MRSVRNAKEEILAFLNAKKEKMGVDTIHDLIPKESSEEWRFVRVNRCKTTVDKVVRILSGVSPLCRSPTRELWCGQRPPRRPHRLRAARSPLGGPARASAGALPVDRPPNQGVLLSSVSPAERPVRRNQEVSLPVRRDRRHRSSRKQDHLPGRHPSVAVAPFASAHPEEPSSPSTATTIASRCCVAAARSTGVRTLARRGSLTSRSHASTPTS